MKERFEVDRVSSPRVQIRKQLAGFAAICIIAVALIHFQNPQLLLESMTISLESLRYSPLYVQNIGTGLLSIDSQGGTGFAGGPNSVFLAPKECVLIAVFRSHFLLFPCNIHPPLVRGWKVKGVQISLDGRSWMQQ